MSARLGYDIHGPQQAPVLVLGSSLGTTRAMWDPLLAPLADAFRVVRFDHRGHGGSEEPPGPYALAELAGDVLDLLDGLGVARFRFAGVSLGGMVGMWLAAHTAERLERLAVLCSSAYMPPLQGWLQRASAVRSGGMAAVADAVMARWFTPAWADAHPAQVGTYRAMLLATPAEGYAGGCEAIGAMDLRPDLPGIRANTLVVAGSADPSSPPWHGAQIAASVPSARLVVLDDTAHLASAQAPAQCASLLLDHFGADRDADEGVQR